MTRSISTPHGRDHLALLSQISMLQPGFPKSSPVQDARRELALAGIDALAILNAIEELHAPVEIDGVWACAECCLDLRGDQVEECRYGLGVGTNHSSKHEHRGEAQRDPHCATIRTIRDA